MAPQILHRVLSPNAPSNPSLTTHPALLPSYRRHRVQNCDYPAITPCAKSSVRGVLVTGLSDRNIRHLDIFEGEEYERVKVRVKVLEDELGEKVVGTALETAEEEVSAETYIWKGLEGLEDAEWDFETFRREKMKAWVRGSKEFDEVDDAVKAERGDPTGGRGMNGGITGILEGQQAQKEKEMLESAV